MAPYAMTKARFGYRMNNATIIDTMVNDALTDAFNHYHMMITAENVCDKYGITREAVSYTHLYLPLLIRRKSIFVNTVCVALISAVVEVLQYIFAVGSACLLYTSRCV